MCQVTLESNKLAILGSEQPPLARLSCESEPTTPTVVSHSEGIEFLRTWAGYISRGRTQISPNYTAEDARRDNCCNFTLYYPGSYTTLSLVKDIEIYIEVTTRYNLNRIVKNCSTIDLWASPQEIIDAKLPKVPTISEKARREHIHFYFDISRAELHHQIESLRITLTKYPKDGPGRYSEPHRLQIITILALFTTELLAYIGAIDGLGKLQVAGQGLADTVKERCQTTLGSVLVAVDGLRTLNRTSVNSQSLDSLLKATLISAAFGQEEPDADKSYFDVRAHAWHNPDVFGKLSAAEDNFLIRTDQVYTGISNTFRVLTPDKICQLGPRRVEPSATLEPAVRQLVLATLRTTETERIQCKPNNLPETHTTTIATAYRGPIAILGAVVASPKRKRGVEGVAKQVTEGEFKEERDPDSDSDSDSEVQEHSKKIRLTA